MAEDGEKQVTLRRQNDTESSTTVAAVSILLEPSPRSAFCLSISLLQSSSPSADYDTATIAVGGRCGRTEST